MKNLYLIAEIAGEKVALNANCIDSVVRVNKPVPVPSVGPSVAGLFAQRSRVLTLIDCQYFVTGNPQEVTDGQVAIVVQNGGHSYGFLVDCVFDVVKPDQPLCDSFAALRAGWGAIGSLMLEYEDDTYLVVDPDMLIRPRLARAA